MNSLFNCQVFGCLLQDSVCGRSYYCRSLEELISRLQTWESSIESKRQTPLNAPSANSESISVVASWRVDPDYVCCRYQVAVHPIRDRTATHVDVDDVPLDVETTFYDLSDMLNAGDGYKHTIFACR